MSFNRIAVVSILFMLAAAIVLHSDPPPMPSWVAGPQKVWIAWEPQETNVYYILQYRTNSTAEWTTYTVIHRPLFHYFVDATNPVSEFRLELKTR